MAEVRWRREHGNGHGLIVDAGLIGLPEAENFLMKELNKTVVREFNKYLAVRLGLSASRTKGEKILVEFMIDARNIYRKVTRKIYEYGAQHGELFYTSKFGKGKGRAPVDWAVKHPKAVQAEEQTSLF